MQDPLVSEARAVARMIHGGKLSRLIRAVRTYEKLMKSRAYVPHDADRLRYEIDMAKQSKKGKHK